MCYPILDDELLLIRKQRGLGAGKLLGPGGKVEPGETLRACVRRECREELRVEPTGLERCGRLAFHFESPEPDERSMDVAVFRADGVRGEPEATEEAVPVRRPVEDPPYEEMWPDDRVWFPHMLDGRTFEGQFVLDETGERLSSYTVELDVTFETDRIDS